MTGLRLFPGGPSQEVSSLIGCIYIQPTHGAPNPWRRQFRNSIKTKQHTKGPGEGWEPGQHYLALLRPDCNKAVPVEKLCFLPIELALLRNDKN